MAYAAGLAVVLTLMWWVLSGQTDPLFLMLGAGSVIFTVALVRRMDLIDWEIVPYQGLHRNIPYWLWLAREIVRANIAVLKLVLRPKLDIEPRVVRAPSTQRSSLALATFANSITLTPGTVAVDVGASTILVHELDASLSSEDGLVEMGRRAAIAFDPPVKPLKP